MTHIFFQYDPAAGFAWCQTAKDAIELSKSAIEQYRREAPEGCDDLIAQVCWGEIKQAGHAVNEDLAPEDSLAFGKIVTIGELKIEASDRDVLYRLANLQAECDSLSLHWDDIQRLVKALSWLGYSTPESQEEQAASQKRLVLDLIRAVEQSKALLTAPLVRDGWQLVPVEPTEEMLDVAIKQSRSIYEPGCGSYLENPADVYMAMLASAPKPEGGAA